MEVKPSKPPIETSEWEQLKSMTTNRGFNYRNIRDDTYTKFGVRHAIDDKGEVIVQYYPCTQDGQLVGLKLREHPKDFRSIGRSGAECELFMQFKFNRGGKYVVITEGELDALSAFQMLNDYNKSKGWDYETAVVSPTTGKNGERQIATNYKFFDSFENIIVCYDNDKAGQEAIDKVVKSLPKGKVKIMRMKYKDANEYLTAQKDREFISAFYDSVPYTPVGVLGSGQLYDRVISQAALEKLPFPPFMNELNDMFAGGLPLGHIINVAAGTGIGKTSFVNELIYYWIYHSPHLFGIVSMELDSGQYGEVLLSRHLSRKISLIGDPSAKMTYLTSPEVKEKANDLFYKDEEGNHRFYLLDNRDGSIEEIQETIEELVVSCGCKIIVLDPLQDILDGLSNEDQAIFMKWCKGIIKSHGCTLILINHMRKTDGREHKEEDIHGSSTIIKSASANILLKRNKEAEDEVERNTTYVKVTKNRICGLTGPAGEVYYDNETHTLWAKSEYFTS